jgi:hypothetical protein
MSGSYTPSLDARWDVLQVILAAADAGKPMPKPETIAGIQCRSTSTIHACLRSLHDDGTIQITHSGHRLIVQYLDGRQTARPSN